MAGYDNEWTRKGATLSDKTAAREYGLSREEIHAALAAGELQFRRQAMHGNPFVRLLRREVEELVARRRGGSHLTEQKHRAGLARIDREIRRLRSKLAALEKERAAWVAEAPPQARK